MADLEAALTKLRERDWQARVEAVLELRAVDDPRAFAAIVAALYDPENTAVTEAATEALVGIGSSEAAEALLAALTSDDHETADHVLDFLSDIEAFVAQVLARNR